METILLKIAITFLIQEQNIRKEKESNQSKNDSYEYVTAIDPIPGGYEHNIRILERTVLTNAPFRENEVIIVISRLNKKENLIYNSHRLYTVKQYLALILKFPANKIITAIGEPVDGYGILEFYVDGKRFSALAIHKNKELQVTEEEEFTPFFYLPTPKQKNKK